MLFFKCDYGEGAHERILEALYKTNYEKLSGYGFDKYCDSAKEKIRIACSAPEAEIFFLVGGTQTNTVAIDSMLKNYEGVICAQTGHIALHEAGAVEYTGHKVITLPGDVGKLKAETLEDYLKSFYADENNEHMVQPGMVYISHPTEYGTLYSKDELEKLSSVCKKFDIPLYLDGARLGYGLMSRNTDVTLPDIAKLCDAFYIGGTKVGALCGEALVFPKNNMPKHYLTIVKQHTALLAKGRLLGIQFDTLFTDNLYFEISRHAIDCAEKLKAILQEKGYEFFIDSPTNQLFVILENNHMKKLSETVEFEIWEKKDENHTVVRFATSWATKNEDIEELKNIL